MRRFFHEKNGFWEVILLVLLATGYAHAQAVPNPVEKIEDVVTFGPQAPPAWGDDDYTQTFFFLVPSTRREPFYIRVFDPDCGGELDAKMGEFDTRTDFSLYGGPGTHSAPTATNPRPAPGTAPSGRLLKQVAFGVDPATDNTYYTFGPLNPLEGELVAQFKGYVFKVVVRGLSGNDGNLYRFFLSSSPTSNVPVTGGNAFTYAYTFRIPANTGAQPVQVHLYPFADERVVSIKQSNFDFDGTVRMAVFSVAKNGHEAATSGNNVWAASVLPIVPDERGLSLDLRMTSLSKVANDVKVYVTDQYDKAMPFFAVPIGGPPRYKYNIDVRIHR